MHKVYYKMTVEHYSFSIVNIQRFVKTYLFNVDWLCIFLGLTQIELKAFYLIEKHLPL